MLDKAMARGSLVVALLASVVSARADVFNMPGTQTSLQFVTVGDPGNVPDVSRIPAVGPIAGPASSGFGEVDYTYQMGKYDVTAAEYCQFLIAVAATDDYALYNPSMALPGAAGQGGCGILRSGSPGSYLYNVLPDNGVPGQPGYANYANFPVNYVSWADAARFCNWLQNGQPTGSEDATTTETGAYALNGAMTAYQLSTVTRSPNATYFLPSPDEWYKAAYYVGGGTNAGYWLYTTASNSAPINTMVNPDPGDHANFFDTYGTGNGGFTDPLNYLTAVGTFSASAGPFGTYDMGGDVVLWTESGEGEFGDYMWMPLVAGASFDSGSDGLALGINTSVIPGMEQDTIGFRVASVPEPSALALLGSALLGLAVVFYLRDKGGESRCFG